MEKQILLLNDAKAGHQNQSRALIKELELISEPNKSAIKRIQLEFKSRFREKFFAFFTLLIYPFLRKKIPLLNKFLAENIINEIYAIKPHIIIAAGSGTVPLALLLSKINRSKTIALMNPAFPFSIFRFDLAIVPKHDKTIRGKNVLDTILALSPFDNKLIQEEALSLKNKLENPEKVKIGILIGGNSKNYSFSKENMDIALNQISLACDKLNVDFIATTCRRTPKDYEETLKETAKKTGHCQLLVLADKEIATNMVSAMIGLCKIIIATEESISMISEPINAGKKTIILKLRGKIYHKYTRFHNILLNNKLTNIANFDTLADKIIEVYKNASYDLSNQERLILEEEKQALRTRLSNLF